MRTCELCGKEADENYDRCACGGEYLPKLPAGGVGRKQEGGIFEGGQETIIHFEPRIECLVCQDTGHVGINVPEGIEVRNCPRGCEPVVIEIDPKRLG